MSNKQKILTRNNNTMSQSTSEGNIETDNNIILDIEIKKLLGELINFDNFPKHILKNEEALDLYIYFLNHMNSAGYVLFKDFTLKQFFGCKISKIRTPLQDLKDAGLLNLGILYVSAVYYINPRHIKTNQPYSYFFYDQYNELEFLSPRDRAIKIFNFSR